MKHRALAKGQPGTTSDFAPRRRRRKGGGGGEGGGRRFSYQSIRKSKRMRRKAYDAWNGELRRSVGD